MRQISWLFGTSTLSRRDWFGRGKVLIVNHPSGFVSRLIIGTPENLPDNEKPLEHGLLFDEK